MPASLTSIHTMQFLSCGSFSEILYKKCETIVGFGDYEEDWLLGYNPHAVWHLCRLLLAHSSTWGMDAVCSTGMSEFLSDYMTLQLRNV
jgi:hypothetical protein